MATKRRRALTADELSLTPEDRAAIRQSRFNAQSNRFQRDRAIEKSAQRAQPQEPKK